MLKGAARNKHRQHNDKISERISQAIFSEEGWGLSITKMLPIKSAVVVRSFSIQWPVIKR